VNHPISDSTLKIEDILATKYLEVSGIEYDTHATALLQRSGKTQDIEVVELERRSLYVVVHRTSGGIETIPIDLEHFSKRLLAEIDRALEVEALRQAKLSDRWKDIDND